MPSEAKDSKRWNVSTWYFVVAMALLMAGQLLLNYTPSLTLAYSDFQTLLQQDRIKEVAIYEDRITGTADLSNDRQLFPEGDRDSLKTAALKNYNIVVVRVADPNLIAELQAARVKFAGRMENRWFGTLLSWIVPTLFFVIIWTLLMRRIGGRMSSVMDIGKSRAKVFVQKETGVHFDDVAGIDEAKDELMEVVDFLKSPDHYRKLGGRIPKGVLIVGAPGTGKTLLAKAVAGEAGVPFLSISGSEFVEMFVGVGAARVRDLFEQAQQLAPCIIFIDELDALGKARGIGGITANDEREQTLNQLLVQMDGFDTRNGVIIMAATNRPEILDPALLRPGRFDRQVALERPDLKGREQILRVHTRHIVMGDDVDLAALAGKTTGFAGAELANIVNEAALLAARKNKSVVEMSDFDAAIERAIAGLEKKNRVINANEKQTIAYHEAGHALIAELRPSADKVSKISIIPRGIGALGFTQQQPTEDRYLLKHNELLDKLDVLLGGRAAELLIFKEASTGAQNDLQRATDMARQMITRYGMSESLGPVVLETPRAPLLFPEAGPGRNEYSEHTAQLIDDEVRMLLQAAQQRVMHTLTQHRKQLEALAQQLLVQETMERSALLRLLSETDITSPAEARRMSGKATEDKKEAVVSQKPFANV
ncbi:MAG TPA: ATP-dependent zinc metalloprotease FtsH [Steroidobacteraceae bacterium]|nr:ATP-dependent zinc metalloprotease FtsH [Steroidobacteraceae bacterium]